jgi:hypothetical protein
MEEGVNFCCTFSAADSNSQSFGMGGSWWHQSTINPKPLNPKHSEAREKIMMLKGKCSSSSKD